MHAPARSILDAYVELELAGDDPARVVPGHGDPPAQLSRAAGPITTASSKRPADSPIGRPSSARAVLPWVSI